VTHKTLVVTNDFPPRIGGIENFVRAVCRALDDDVVVLTSGEPGAAAYDARLPFPVIRRGRVLLPTPATARSAVRLLHQYQAHRVLFGAAAPLGLLAGRLRRAGARHIVGLTHGHESWWARVPVAAALLRRIGEETDHLGVISTYTRAHIAPVLTPAARSRMLPLPPPYDARPFHPQSQRSRPEHDPRRCVTVGRLVRRKGFDLLLQAWARVQRDWNLPGPPPELVLVGDGPQRQALTHRCRTLGLTAVVRFAGAQPPTGVAAELGRADVFAFPVRARLGGLDSEGLGLAVVEAAACGLPVIVARSGGAPDTLRDGVTGLLVEPDQPDALADALLVLLSDPIRARAMGEAGRTFVAERFGFEHVRQTVRAALGLP
jgi:phosphatidyl-myo-inositol dimannoside synthase